MTPTKKPTNKVEDYFEHNIVNPRGKFLTVQNLITFGYHSIASVERRVNTMKKASISASTASLLTPDSVKSIKKSTTMSGNKSKYDQSFRSGIHAFSVFKISQF